MMWFQQAVYKVFNNSRTWSLIGVIIYKTRFYNINFLVLIEHSEISLFF